MNCKYDFQFGHMEMTEACAVFITNEGVDIDSGEVKEVLDVLKEYYGETEFGFIANRINSYSVNPQAVANFFLHKNLVAGAIVSKTRLGKLNSRLERKFIKAAQTQHFENVESAINWVEQVVSGNPT